MAFFSRISTFWFLISETFYKKVKVFNAWRLYFNEDHFIKVTFSSAARSESKITTSDSCHLYFPKMPNKPKTISQDHLRFLKMKVCLNEWMKWNKHVSRLCMIIACTKLRMANTCLYWTQYSVLSAGEKVTFLLFFCIYCYFFLLRTLKYNMNMHKAKARQSWILL